MNLTDWSSLLETILICYSIISVVVVPAIFWILNSVHKIKTSLNYHFNNNGGKSLLDKVDRIASKIELQEARWRASNNYHYFGIYECDLEGYCVFSNHTLCKMFGLSEEEMFENGWLAVVKEREEVLEKWQNSIKEHIPYENEYTVKNKVTGEVFKVKSTAYPLKSRKGEILGYYVIVEKI